MPGSEADRTGIHRVVREEGLEPSHPFGHRNLNPARLPIPPLARVAEERLTGPMMFPLR